MTVSDSKLHLTVEFCFDISELYPVFCTWHCPAMPKRCSMALKQPVGTKGDASRHFVSGIETLPYLKRSKTSGILTVLATYSIYIVYFND